MKNKKPPSGIDVIVASFSQTLRRPDVKPERPDQRVVCAALRMPGMDRIICGPRHYDPIMRAQIEAHDAPEHWRGSEQGFVDNYGTFLTREEAYVVAKAARQIRRRCGGDDGVLFSENLY